MNETLFTFPAESGSSTGGDKLFDLSGLTQADGDASENPFAAMLAEGEAAGQKEDANPSPALELMSGISQAQQAETETENNTACILSSKNPWFCQSKFLGIATGIPW